MKKIALINIGLLLYVFTFAQQQFSLEEAINYAMQNNLDIKNTQLDIADADQQIIERRAIGIPKLNGVVDFSHAIALPTSLVPASFIDPMAGSDEFAELVFGTKNSMNIGLEMNTLIFDFSYIVGLRAAKAFKNYVQQQYLQKQYEIKNQIIESFLPLLILEESKATLDKNITNIENLLHETSEMYKAGFVEKLDVDRLTLSISNLKTERMSIESQVKMAYQVLKFNMGYPQSEELILTDDMESALELATGEELEGTVSYEQRPEYRVINLGEELNELNIKLSRSGYYPSVSGFGYVTYNGQGQNIFKNAFWNKLSAVGVSLNVPIFSGLERKAKVQRARLDMESLLLRKKQLENAINLEVNTARINYVNTVERMENQKQNVALSEDIYNTTLIKYKEGVGSSLEVSQAEQALYQTQQNYTQSLYEIIKAKSALDKALGI